MKYDIIIRHTFHDDYKQEIITDTKLIPNRKYLEPVIKTKYANATRNYFMFKLLNKLPEELLQEKATRKNENLTKHILTQKKNTNIMRLLNLICVVLCYIKKLEMKRKKV